MVLIGAGSWTHPPPRARRRHATFAAAYDAARRPVRLSQHHSAWAGDPGAEHGGGWGAVPGPARTAVCGPAGGRGGAGAADIAAGGLELDGAGRLRGADRGDAGGRADEYAG